MPSLPLFSLLYAYTAAIVSACEALFAVLRDDERGADVAMLMR